MKRVLTTIVAGGMLLSVSAGLADSHEAKTDEANYARPVETFSCRYNEGKGPADLDAVVKKFNAWGDKQGIDNYWAWTMVPYYFSPAQEFDLLWMGASPDAKTLGKVQDQWLASGGKVQDSFNEVLTCDAHSNAAVLQMKESPERADRSRGVVSFSDCKMADGVTFDDMYPALAEWSKYITEQGSKSGMFVFFPAYGGGGEKFDFKWVNSHQNLEEMGEDWDNYSQTGWEKANELFAGKLDCDSARAYLSTTRRMPKGDDE